MRTTQAAPSKIKGKLSEKSKKVQQEKATAYMKIEFHDGKTFACWSDEWKKSNIKSIDQAIMRMWALFDIYWRKNAKQAVIFDVRVHKTIGAYNKIYQYEKGAWFKVMDY